MRIAESIRRGVSLHDRRPIRRSPRALLSLSRMIWKAESSEPCYAENHYRRLTNRIARRLIEVIAHRRSGADHPTSIYEIYIAHSEIRISSFTPVAEHLDGDVGRDLFLSGSLCALLLRNERSQKTRMDPPWPCATAGPFVV